MRKYEILFTAAATKVATEQRMLVAKELYSAC